MSAQPMQPLMPDLVSTGAMQDNQPPGNVVREKSRPLLMEAKPIAEKGPLKHFTFRDVFYAIGAIAAAVMTYSTIVNRVDSLERDSARENKSLHGRVDENTKWIEDMRKEMSRMDHEGTIASRNGLYQESAISKANGERVKDLEQKHIEIVVMMAEIRADLKNLMKSQGVTPVKQP